MTLFSEASKLTSDMVFSCEWIEALRDLLQLEAMSLTMCNKNWLDKAVGLATSQTESLQRTVIGAEIFSNLYSVSIFFILTRIIPNVQLAMRPYSVTR